MIFLLCVFLVFNVVLGYLSVGRVVLRVERAALKRTFEVERVDKGPDPGTEIPAEIAAMKPIYDMILVERVSAPKQTNSGLFLPTTEGDDQKRLGVVLSVPEVGYGLESEGGRVQSFDEMAPVKVGDMVYVRDPWGIGPKNIEIGGRCFSFHKANHVTAIVQR